MGCPLSIKVRTSEPFQNAVMIDSVHSGRVKTRTKLIVLGTSNSGKSTLLRQFQILNTPGFTTAERHSYVPLIINNIVKSLHFILQKAAMSKTVFEDAQIEEAAKNFLTLYSEETSTDIEINSKLLQLSMILWQSATIRELFDVYRDDFENGDTLLCLFDELERISQLDYLPSNQDILYCRMRSTGIKTLRFDFDDTPLEMIDVGGQRSERRKWIHYFDDVEVVLFCVSANEYSMMLREDPSKNAMEESLDMFKSIINSIWFMNKPIILFLNKSDLLEKRIKHSCIKDYFPEFSGNPGQYSDVANFIKLKFLQCNRQKDRQIFVFNTCATDTTNIERISKICFHTVFKRTLADMGF